MSILLSSCILVVGPVVIVVDGVVGVFVVVFFLIIMFEIRYLVDCYFHVFFVDVSSTIQEVSMSTCFLFMFMSSSCLICFARERG